MAAITASRCRSRSPPGKARARVRREAPDRVMAEVRGEPRGVLHDDMAHGLGQALLLSVAEGLTWPASHGVFTGQKTPRFDELLGTTDVRSVDARRITGEQSNTSVVLGDRRHPQADSSSRAGPEPRLRDRTPPHRPRAVPRRAGARRGGAVAGDGIASPIVVAVAQAFVPGAVPVRERVVPAIAAFMRDAGAGAGERRHVDRARRRVRGTVRGRRGARTEDGRAAPRARGRARRRGLRAGAGQRRRPAARSRATCADRWNWPSMPCQNGAASPARERRRARRAGARVEGPADRRRSMPWHGSRRASSASACTATTNSTRCCGHGGDFVIIDFEGEPLRPVSERRAKFLALKDVAGMARSYSYAAYAALFDVAGDDDETGRAPGPGGALVAGRGDRRVRERLSRGRRQARRSCPRARRTSTRCWRRSSSRRRPTSCATRSATGRGGCGFRCAGWRTCWIGSSGQGPRSSLIAATRGPWTVNDRRLAGVVRRPIAPSGRPVSSLPPAHQHRPDREARRRPTSSSTRCPGFRRPSLTRVVERERNGRGGGVAVAARC